MKYNFLTDSIIKYIYSDKKGAILINGDWGTGKTFFIKNFIEKATISLDDYNYKFNPNGTKLLSNDKKIIYVSLNGLSSIEEIKTIIFNEISSTLEKGIKFGLKILGNSLRKNLTTNLGDINFESTFEKLKKFDADVFIFDDLERCHVDIINLFGFLNSLVEEENKKVILISCEKELEIKINEESDSHNELIAFLSLDSQNRKPENLKEILNDYKNIKQKPYYKIIKEKTIYKTFKFDIELNYILEQLLENNEYSKFNNTYKNYKNLIISIFDDYNCRNIRTLVFSLDCLNFIFNILNNIHLYKSYKDTIYRRSIEHAIESCIFFKNPELINNNKRKVKELTKFEWIDNYIFNSKFDKNNAEEEIKFFQKALQENVIPPSIKALNCDWKSINSDKFIKQKMNKIENDLNNNKIKPNLFPLIYHLYYKFIVNYEFVQLNINTIYTSLIKKIENYKKPIEGTIFLDFERNNIQEEQDIDHLFNVIKKQNEYINVLYLKKYFLKCSFKDDNKNEIIKKYIFSNRGFLYLFNKATIENLFCKLTNKQLNAFDKIYLTFYDGYNIKESKDVENIRLIYNLLNNQKSDCKSITKYSNIKSILDNLDFRAIDKI